MAPTTVVLALALLTSSSFALPFNFPFWGQPDNGFWHPNHHPHGPPNGRPQPGHEGPHKGPGWDHPFHYTVIGPWDHPEKPTSTPTSSESTTSSAFPTTTNVFPPIGTGFSSYTGPMYTYPLRTSTGTGFAYPTGTGHAHPTGTGLPFPSGEPYLPNPNPPYGFFQPPVESAPASLTKRFEGPRRHRGGPQQQQWQHYDPHHGYHGGEGHHGPPRYGGPPHSGEKPTPTAGGVASTGLIRPTGGFMFPTGGYAAPKGFAWPSGKPEWHGEGEWGPPGWGGREHRHGHGWGGGE